MSRTKEVKIEVASIVAQKLRKARGNRSRTKVAADLDISYQTLSAYEKGYCVPSDKVKVKLAEYYGLTVQELFFDQ